MTLALLALILIAFGYIVYLWREVKRQEFINSCVLNCIEKIYEEIELLKNEVQNEKG